MVKIYTAIPTPFLADGEIDFDLLADLVNWQRDMQKMSGLFPIWNV